jgi:hypothetical protein
VRIERFQPGSKAQIDEITIAEMIRGDLPRCSEVIHRPNDEVLGRLLAHDSGGQAQKPIQSGTRQQQLGGKSASSLLVRMDAPVVLDVENDMNTLTVRIVKYVAQLVSDSASRPRCGPGRSTAQDDRRCIAGLYSESATRRETTEHDSDAEVFLSDGSKVAQRFDFQLHAFPQFAGELVTVLGSRIRCAVGRRRTLERDTGPRGFHLAQ